VSALTETFDGIANGVAITTSNTGFTFIDGAPVADTALKMHGAASADMNITAAQAGLTHTFSSTLSTHYVRLYVYMDSMPSANTKILTARNAGNTAQCWDCRVTNGGAVQIRNSSSSQIQISSTGVVSTGSWWRLEAGMASGSLEVRVYTTPESTSPAVTLSGSFADTVASRIVAGTAASATWDFHVDSYKSSDSTWVGPENALTSVTSSRATTWDVRTLVTGSRATSWDVASSLISVTSSRATSWDVLAQRTSSRATSWDVLSNIPAGQHAGWGIPI
jgi:hypothetical protein